MTMNEKDKQAEPVAVDHSDLIKRIDAAIDRVTQGRGLMSIPADPRSDVDLVLSECKALLQGENPPFWATDFHPAQPLGNAELEQIWKTKFELQFGVSRTLFMAIAREVMHPTIGGLRSGE